MSAVHNSQLDRSEKLHQKRGKTVSAAASGYIAASENNINKKQERNWSKAKRAVNKTGDIQISKVSKVISASNSHCQKFSTAPVQNSMKDIVIKTANRTLKQQKHGEVDKIATFLLNDIEQMNLQEINLFGNKKPSKNKAVINSTWECKNNGNIVNDVLCKRSKKEHTGPSLNTTCDFTMTPSRKMTGSGATGKQACSVLSCKEVKFHVTDATVKANTELSDASSSLNCNVTTFSNRTISLAPAANAAYEQEDDVKSGEVKSHVSQPVQEAVMNEIPLSCSGFGMTLQSSRERKHLTGGNCEQASGLVHSTEEKNAVTETVQGTNDGIKVNMNTRKNEYKEAGRSSRKHLNGGNTVCENFSGLSHSSAENITETSKATEKETKTNKNTRKRKHCKVKETVSVPFNYITHQHGLLSTISYNNETENSCEVKCTNSLRTKHLISDKSRKKECKDVFLNSTFDSTLTPGRNRNSVAESCGVTGSSGTLHKQAGGSVSCKEVKNKVAKAKKSPLFHMTLRSSSVPGVSE